MSKAEVYFFGQIVGATEFTEGVDGIFVEVFFDHGKNWEFLSGNQTYQTQSGYVDDDDFVCFAHPFDLHFSTTSYFGWPKIIAKIWKLDETNTIDLLSYGGMNLPTTKGFHKVSFDTWVLHGDSEKETFSYFLDSKPTMSNSGPIFRKPELRNKFITKTGPKIHLEIEVLLKNFEKNKRELATP